jgi:hypothetical protein
MHHGPDAFLHQVVGGRWRLLEVLGPTEHGAAFRAETLEDGRPARLELWDLRHVEGRGELARFEREARTLSRLRHERCLSVSAFGAHEGRPFLVSELPAGTTLRDELRAGELSLARALSLGLQLCEGLRHLHGHGVVHRALLPENLWVTRSPGADLLKIGLPRIGQATGAPDASRAPFYPPPGRTAGRPDHRADLYAAGMLLYLMCTGRELAAEVAAEIAGGGPVPPPSSVSPERGISDALERVILRAVAPSPEVRFGTADELLGALQSAGIRPAAPKRRPAQPARRRTAMLAAGFVALAVLGAGALRSRGSQAPSAPPAPHVASVPAPPPAAPRPVQAAPAAAPILPPPVAPVEPTPVAPVPAPAPYPVAIAAAPAAPASPAAPPPDQRRQVWALLDSGRLDEGAARIKALEAKDPDGAWPQFALGVLYYRKYWRRDAVRHWQLALEQDPEIRHDPQFGAYFCFMLDDTWKAAGMTELLDELGAEAAPLLEQCVASAKTPRLRELASATLAHLPRTHHRRFRR